MASRYALSPLDFQIVSGSAYTLLLCQLIYSLNENYFISIMGRKNFLHKKLGRNACRLCLGQAKLPSGHGLDKSFAPFSLQCDSTDECSRSAVLRKSQGHDEGNDSKHRYRKKFGTHRTKVHSSARRAFTRLYRYHYWRFVGRNGAVRFWKNYSPLCAESAPRHSPYGSVWCDPIERKGLQQEHTQGAIVLSSFLFLFFF